jgi:glycosyltransferase involved in cell wall biosynthesis
LPATNTLKKFSILIPTWNNLAYLELCIKSIQQHSSFNHELIILINEGNDGTVDWVKNQPDLTYIHYTENMGICHTLNAGAAMATTDYILYLNDDMYVLPEWDVALAEEVENIGHTRFFLSATMIEPTNTGNACVVVKDFGNNLENFKKEELLKSFSNLEKQDWAGATWPPNLLHIDSWKAVGGMSIEFSPGMYSDPDLSMKLWQHGIRYFKGVGKSKVYHFGTKSTGRVKQNKGRETFIKKWGITPGDFTKYYLRRGSRFKGPLPEVKNKAWLKLKTRIKQIFR